MPIYLVSIKTGRHAAETRIVEAVNKYTAINHVIKDTIDAKTLTASEMLEHIDKGVKVEKAGGDIGQHTEATVTESADVKAMNAADKREPETEE